MEDQPQVRDLQALAIAKFDKPALSDAEKLLLEKFVTGGWAFCGPKPKGAGPNGRPPKEDKDPNNDPQDADKWEEKRQIRAELLAWLCMNQEARKCVHVRGIQVYGADVKGDLDLSLQNIPFQLAFQHCRLNVISLQQAEVSQLDLQGSLARAIKADSLIVKNNVALRWGFSAVGEVKFPFAQIGGVLDCSRGTFTNPPLKDKDGKDIEGSGRALYADGINVRGYVFLNHGFAAKGEVSFSFAQIGGVLDCSRGTFTNPPQKDKDGKDIEGSGSALNAAGIVVKGGVFLRNCFKAVGTVNLYGAQIGLLFNCINGNFENATLDLRDASATSLIDSGLNDPDPNPTGPVDDPTKWPPRSKQPSEQPCELLLGGFVYDRISSAGNINALNRLAWLRLQPRRPFRRQPYLHLAKVLQDSGDSDGALRVRIKMEELSRSGEEAGSERSPKGLNKILSLIRIGMARFWSWFLKWSIGYGYLPKRAIWLIILLSALGWIVYDGGYRAGTMVPTDEKAYTAFKDSNTEPRVPPHYPSFSPLFYSLENSLPLVKFGQGEKWHPVSSRFATSSWFVNCFLRIQILLGWLFATLFVAGVSGIVHKE